jgi:hypothetical protein
MLDIRTSNLCGIRTVAEFYQKKFLHKPVERDYFDIGTAAHAYILQPEVFKKIIVVADDPPEPDNLNMDGSLKKTGANGKYLKEIKAKNSSKIVFEPYWFAQVVNYANSIKQIPGFDRLVSLNAGLAEHKMQLKYNDSVTIHGTADYIKPRAFITDLKFSAKITDFEINKMFADYEYHIRAALYLDLWNRNNPDEEIDTFAYIIVEKSENPVARFLVMSEQDIQQGRLLYTHRLEKITEAYKSGEWIQNSMEAFELQPWVHDRPNYF